MMGQAHLIHNVRPQPLAHKQELAQKGVSLVAKRPHFVGGAGLPELAIVWLTVTVQAERGAKGPILEPAHDQLAEIG